MRNVPKIWEAWSSGTYVGETKPSTRVTVEQNFLLRATGPVVGQWTRGPARWFQRDDHTEQVETEIPNVISVNTSRSSEPDAGTCDIVIRNAVMPELGIAENPVGQFGDMGYYTPDRGAAQDARARWGHVSNPWSEVLVPNALVRTYMGFGGHEKTVAQAVFDENVVLNGVWLIDEVTVTTDGTLTLRCRDMAKLLIDQQLFPPLVPEALYPLKYERYRLDDYPIPADPPPAPGTTNRQAVYGSCGDGPFSSTDALYGEFDTAMTGHRPSDAFDISYETGPDEPGAYAHQRTYWLSEPKDDPSDHVWIDVCSEGLPVNVVYAHLWGGNYLTMVSVFEDGEWVPPEAGGEGGYTPDGLPYVTAFTVGWEGDQRPGKTNQYRLPRDYRALRVRLTFTNLTRGSWNPARDDAGFFGSFHAGLRKIMLQWQGEFAEYPVLTFASAALPYNTDNRYGYWQVRGNGKLYAFGDARTHPLSDTSPWSTNLGTVIGMTAHPGGLGYWTVDSRGRVLAFGAAQYAGDLSAEGRSDVVDIAAHPNGSGYWLLTKNGQVFNYNAVQYGDATVTGTMPTGTPIIARSIESHPTTPGYWVLLSDGSVQAFNLPWLGAANRVGFYDTEYVGSIRRSSTGNGYWITSGQGIVQGFGDATNQGSGSGAAYQNAQWPYKIVWDLIPSSAGDDGYFIQRADGTLEGFGDFLTFGSIGEGFGQLRYDGDYKDYADIIRDLLLWAGFNLYKNPPPGSETAAVYGSIESTGAFADDKLPAEMFDKRAVLDAIKDIRAIVGYVFYINAEGAAIFESPNWWTMGNFLSDISADHRTPFAHMPEIDEAVQLTNHSVVRSAAAARSKLIIATQSPYPEVRGGEVPEALTITTITPTTAKDLKGLLVPAMWTNGQFLRPDEQRVMAELIDMQMWFARRTGQIQCVANPLIDVNDQIRVIERQTSECYVHYIKSVSISHDLNAGSFTMSLTTHWLGGTPYGQSTLYFACIGRPQGDGYWQVTAFGNVFAFGNAQIYDRHQHDKHVRWVISMRSTPTGLGYYTLDQHGTVLTYGDAVYQGSLHSPPADVIDMALTPSGLGYWLLQLNGTVTAFGDAVHHGDMPAGGTMPSGGPLTARSIESHPTIDGYWILHSNGLVQGFNLPHHGNADRDGFRLAEYVNRLRRTTDGSGYWIASGSGIMQSFNAPYHGSGAIYPDAQWVAGIVWDFLTDPDGGYALQRAEGKLEMFEFGDLGATRQGESQLSWALVNEEIHALMPDQTAALAVSPAVMKFLQGTASPSANNAVANNFGAPDEPTLKALAP